MREFVKPDIYLGDRPIAVSSVLPPHVSLVLVNRDYSEFIGATIKSIRDQTYPLFDCLIVDNASTDNSLAVIRQHIADDPRFAVIELDKNYGHIGAAMKVMDRVVGEFVCFIDADDLIFPEFLASHLQAHLALDTAVAITTCNYTEIDRDGHLISGSAWWLMRYVGENEEIRRFRPARAVPRLPGVSEQDFARLGEVSMVRRWDVRGWLWASGTGNMYRRSALRHLMPDFGGKPRFGGVDAHFNYLCHALTGTGQIDTPLVAYRVHGRNDYARGPMLENVTSGAPHNYKVDHDIKCFAFNMLLERVDKFSWLVGEPRFWGFLDVVAYRVHYPLYVFYGESVEMLAKHYGKLVKIFGEEPTLTELRYRLSHKAFRRLLNLAHDGHVPFRTERIAFRIEVRRHLRRFIDRFRRKPAAA